MNHYLAMLKTFEHLEYIKASALFTSEERMTLIRDLRSSIPPEHLTPGAMKTRSILLNKIDEALRGPPIGTTSEENHTERPRAAKTAKPIRKNQRPQKEAVLT